MDYYTGKLLFERLWDWGTRLPLARFGLARLRSFVSVARSSGTWLSIFVEDVDDYLNESPARAELICARRTNRGAFAKSFVIQTSTSSGSVTASLCASLKSRSSVCLEARLRSALPP